MTSPSASEPPSVSDAHVARDALLKLADEFLAGQESSSNHRRSKQTELLEQVIGEEACRRIGCLRLSESFLLSVVVPVFNEAQTIERVIERVRAVGLPCEIVVVDDGSTDGTREVLEGISDNSDVKIVLHERNQGKGTALRTGFSHVSGDAVVIQDADMEYDPRDFNLLLQPILEDQADVVYGSRFSSRGERSSPLWHQTGNQLITTLSNLSTGQKFTDVETCYKMFRREHLDRLAPTLGESGFGIELEMTAKLAKMKDVRFRELPISYEKRTYAEGKKIGWRDAVWAMWCILRY